MEKLEEIFKNKAEKGANIELVLHILRHGDRNLDGSLEDYGRSRTKENAKNSPLLDESFDIVKAFGSAAGPKVEVPGDNLMMQRSLETAHIFGKELAGDKLYKTRPKWILNYENLILDTPFDYLKIHENFANEYISNILKYKNKTFNDLSDNDKKRVSEYADAKSVSYLMELDTEEARDSRREIAGSFAVLIKHYVKMIQEKLKSDQKLLFPLGSHTGMIEPFLAETVIWKNKNGEEIHGATFEEIGGNFVPSEGFDVVLKTNQDRKLESVRLRFDNQERLGGEIFLNMRKIDELAEFYQNLHADNS
ncbi:MAG: hypothetical protein ACD_11C00103G0005 [uncultured bacterium]|nr:MAG: hypothetical protein ACD_11C00103G0005 [uncultured bacterium]HBR71910.1 hypothetical protein [Candidatus Moranbacteria bacterium]